MSFLFLPVANVPLPAGARPFDGILAAIPALEPLEFRLIKIRTDGESEVDVGVYPFMRTYRSFEEFQANVREDFHSERHGNAWDDIRFVFSCGTLYHLIIEIDAGAFWDRTGERPHPATWWLHVYDEKYDRKLVRRVKQTLGGLKP